MMRSAHVAVMAAQRTRSRNVEVAQTACGALHSLARASDNRVRLLPLCADCVTPVAPSRRLFSTCTSTGATCRSASSADDMMPSTASRETVAPERDRCLRLRTQPRLPCRRPPTLRRRVVLMAVPVLMVVFVPDLRPKLRLVVSSALCRRTGTVPPCCAHSATAPRGLRGHVCFVANRQLSAQWVGVMRYPTQLLPPPPRVCATVRRRRRRARSAVSPLQRRC